VSSPDTTLLDRSTDLSSKREIFLSAGHHSLRSPAKRPKPSTSPPPSTFPPIPGKTARKVEVGFVTEVTPVPFYLIFEKAPVWLLALEPSICSGVYIGGVSSPKELLELLASRGCDPTLYNRTVARLGVGRIHYCGSTPAPDIATTLISGSYPFLQQVASVSWVGRTLLVLDEPWRGKAPKSLHEVSWRRLKPTQFGGSTNYPVLLGTSDFDFLVQGSSLSRTIGHNLDHGIHPLFLAASVGSPLDTLQSQFYVSNSLLDPRYLDRPVTYQTSYSSSRWGSRLLTAEEIGVSFGLPTWLSLGGLETSMFPIVPLQVLSGCLSSLDVSTERNPAASRDSLGAPVSAGSALHMVACHWQTIGPLLD
jgi:hypothetical protein